MASVPERVLDTLPDAGEDRRMVPRSDLCLGVTLRRPGDEAIIPAAIANLSPTGFLAEIPEGTTLPEFLDADLPNAGSRKAQVVWISGTMAGCNFLAPLGKADLSAARLKSAFADPSPSDSSASDVIAPMFGVGPSDPIWDLINEARPREKWPLRQRMLLIAAAGAIPWLSFVGIAALLV